jgi:hypothetical protein
LILYRGKDVENRSKSKGGGFEFDAQSRWVWIQTGQTRQSARTKSGASADKRQRLSGDTSEIVESEESEASPENYAGETKESDSDRRGRQKEEREQREAEGIAERDCENGFVIWDQLLLGFNFMSQEFVRV